MMNNFDLVLEGLGGRNSAQARVGAQQRQDAQKKRQSEHDDATREKEAALGKMKAKVDFDFWEYALNTLKDRKLADLLNDVLKSSNNIDGKLRIVDEKDDCYIIRMKSWEIDVPKKFVTITSKKK